MSSVMSVSPGLWGDDDDDAAGRDFEVVRPNVFKSHIEISSPPIFLGNP